MKKDATCPRCGAAAYPEEMCSDCFRKAVAQVDPPAMSSPSEDVVTKRSDFDSAAYARFLAAKAPTLQSYGFDADDRISPKLFAFQRQLVSWATRRGRAALFADTGLGKGFMILEWCRLVAEHTGKPVLILAPLAVSRQFASEAKKLGVAVTICAQQSDVRDGVNITNYQKLHKFDASVFAGVALDESSILKAFDGATRTTLIETFAATPYRLCATATPSPNDHTELGNTAEFLSVMRRTEMLSRWFINDTGDTTAAWRLKGHAVKNFWQWVASWAVALKRPSDLGFSDDGYDLPPLEVHSHVLPMERAEVLATGRLLAEDALTLSDQRAARRATLDKRVAMAAAIANESKEPVVVWCDLNSEGDALEKAINDAVQVAGANTDEEKEQSLSGFAEGKIRAIVTKSSVAGWGLNWQHCARVVFCGVTHSFESYYQCIRRCWRFGQTRPVHVHVVSSEAEGRVLDSLAEKEAAAESMTRSMVAAMAEISKDEIRATSRTHTTYAPRVDMIVPEWLTGEAA